MYTSFIKTTALLLAIGLFTISSSHGQSAPSQLDGYISAAFASNQGLKQQQFDLDRSLAALKEAKAMYLPTVSVLGSYTKSSGGRTIDVPLGDLLNPAYSALNQLTGAAFPTLQNQAFLLNPDNFYDAKVRTSLPLINAEIRYNKLIKQEMITGQQAALNVYKRALVKDIKTAYFRYFQAVQAVAIYQSALLLIKENIRVNESLLRNGMRNGTALLRSQTEQEKTMAALVQAQRNTQNARSYFNFLLNRPLTDTIYTQDMAQEAMLKNPDTLSGVKGREELKQLESLREVYTLNERMQKSGLLPKLNTFIDLGSQGFDWNVNNKTRYYLWGVNLQWDVFTGGQRKYRAQQSRASLHAAEAQLEQTQASLQLQLDQYYNNFQSARVAYKSAAAQLSFALKYHNDQLKAYRAGQLLYLELIDAENQLSAARLQLAEAQASLQITLAELEYGQASYPINHTN